MPSAPTGERVWARTFVDAMSLAGAASAVIAFVVALAAVCNLVRIALSILLARRSRRRTPTAPVALVAMPSVSVVVAAYDEEANLPATLRAVTALQAGALEIVVVDDGSRDGTAALVERWPDDRVRLVRTRHAGKAAALSAGLVTCRGEIVVTIDADTRPDRDALRHLVAPFRDPRVAAVSGNLRIADPSGRLGRAQQLEYVIANAFDRRALDVLGSQVTVPGAIGAYRRSTLLAHGGFDAGTLAEDTDLTLAMVAAGHLVRFAPSAYARTEAPASIRALWRQRSRWSFGILQSVWRRRPRRGVAHDPRSVGTWTYALLAQVVAPLLSPLLDVAALWALFTGTTWPLVLWSAVLVVQLAAAAYALRCEDESFGLLWAFPLHVLGYRQLTAFVVPQAVAWALAGRRPGWRPAARRPGSPTVAVPIGKDTATPPATIDPPVPVSAAGAAARA
jgi:cellulose synthase/poly-beta-1,6-N-acetylglucosamine synthase-like glycosyltransferase